MDIHLQGFNMEELKDIIGYIRSVEAFRPSRIVLVNFDAPDDNAEEALRRIMELWPEWEGPPLTAILKREKKKMTEDPRYSEDFKGRTKSL